jgi:hypothetical protein
MMHGPPHIEPFTGEDAEPFTQWLRRFNDYAEALEKPWSDGDKLRKLKAFLRGGPREKWDEFTDVDKASFATATAKLKSLYENTFSKDIAKLNLARCRHRAGESISDFVERLRKLVKAATVGSSTECFKERFLEEFLDRLDEEIGFHVKALMPKNMEEAVCQAMRFEGLLGARKQKRSVEDQAEQVAARVIAALSLGEDGQVERNGFQVNHRVRRRIQCHSCGEWGHIRRDCQATYNGWKENREYHDYQRWDDDYYGCDTYNGRHRGDYVNQYEEDEEHLYRANGPRSQGRYDNREHAGRNARYSEQQNDVHGGSGRNKRRYDDRDRVNALLV